MSHGISQALPPPPSLYLEEPAESKPSDCGRENPPPTILSPAGSSGWSLGHPSRPHLLCWGLDKGKRPGEGKAAGD